MYTVASLVFPAKETFLTDDEVRDLGEEKVDEVEVEGEKEEEKFGDVARVL